MNKARRALALALLCAAHAAAGAADVGECLPISDDVVRLFCYDRAAGRAPATRPPPATPDALQPAAAVAPEPVPQPEKRAKAAKRIEARIAGRFEGWSPGTRFKLDNGEVWQAVGSGTHYSKSESPAVVIERDFLGQNLMSVEGVKSKAIVQRVDE